MPIVLNTKDGSFVLRCINSHPPSDAEATTMRSIDGWLSVPGGRIDPVSKQMQSSDGLKLRCYHCHVCGYVEMYMAGVADPAGAPGG